MHLYSSFNNVFKPIVLMHTHSVWASVLMMLMNSMTTTLTTILIQATCLIWTWKIGKMAATMRTKMTLMWLITICCERVSNFGIILTVLCIIILQIDFDNHCFRLWTQTITKTIQLRIGKETCLWLWPWQTEIQWRIGQTTTKSLQFWIGQTLRTFYMNIDIYPLHHLPHTTSSPKWHLNNNQNSMRWMIKQLLIIILSNTHIFNFIFVVGSHLKLNNKNKQTYFVYLISLSSSAFKNNFTACVYKLINKQTNKQTTTTAPFSAPADKFSHFLYQLGVWEYAIVRRKNN